LSTILVLAAHPDDEVLGVGGTIARHASAGDQVHVVVAAEGVTSRDTHRDADGRKMEIEQLHSATHRAAEELGVTSVRFLGFPDNRCDAIDRLEITKAVETAIEQLRPDTVYVHHGGDVNVDHRRLNEAAFTACRPVPQHPVTRLATFETVSSTEWMPPGCFPVFQPNLFVDIAPYWPTKLAALRRYEEEMRPWPHPRSIEAIESLARWRGATVGVEMAEAFVLLRDVVR
jgi:LmbE family N-acetylglucosaminyl deacetylase